MYIFFFMPYHKIYSKEGHFAISALANILCGRAMMRATSVLGVGFIAIILVGFLGLYHSTHPVRQPKPESVEGWIVIFSSSYIIIIFYLLSVAG